MATPNITLIIFWLSALLLAIITFVKKVFPDTLNGAHHLHVFTDGHDKKTTGPGFSAGC